MKWSFSKEISSLNRKFPILVKPASLLLTKDLVLKWVIKLKRRIYSLHKSLNCISSAGLVPSSLNSSRQTKFLPFTNICIIFTRNLWYKVIMELITFFVRISSTLLLSVTQALLFFCFLLNSFYTAVFPSTFPKLDWSIPNIFACQCTKKEIQ